MTQFAHRHAYDVEWVDPHPLGAAVTKAHSLTLRRMREELEDDYLSESHNYSRSWLAGIIRNEMIYRLSKGSYYDARYAP